MYPWNDLFEDLLNIRIHLIDTNTFLAVILAFVGVRSLLTELSVTSCRTVYFEICLILTYLVENLWSLMSLLLINFLFYFWEIMFDHIKDVVMFYDATQRPQTKTSATNLLSEFQKCRIICYWIIPSNILTFVVLSATLQGSVKSLLFLQLYVAWVAEWIEWPLRNPSTRVWISPYSIWHVDLFLMYSAWGGDPRLWHIWKMPIDHTIDRAKPCE